MLKRQQRKWLTVLAGRIGLRWVALERALLSSLGLRHWYERRLCARIRATGLFDREWYLDSNGDVSASGRDPLLHYARYGDREGRAPMPLFDPGYYRMHADGTVGRSNALLHYAWVGRYRKVATSPWFDVDYYLRLNRDVARLGRDPLLHYVEQGGCEGRAPCAQFDAAWYLNSNPDVQASGVNPLLHFLAFGRVEGRPVLPPDGVSAVDDELPSAFLPSEDYSLDLLPLRPPSPHPTVDIVVPVYKGLAETARCLRSVLRCSADIGFELVVVDDATPDPDLAAALDRWAAKGHFTLLRNALNAGFVASSNRGMALHPGRDVVLLNSDTEVYGDWIDRLHRAAYARPRTGTVTPLSNNATIASYPRFLHDNPYPLEIPFAELDALAASVNRGVAVEAPTGVGFCMYIRRDCLSETGLFDEESFGRGYGEENDLCQRAIRRGWRNLIAADVFVHHLGSVSFLGERANRVREALVVLDRLHPSYQSDVQEFIGRDPLQEARANIDRARLMRSRGGKNVLMICHNRGGGAERALREEALRLREEGYGVFYLRPVRGRRDGAWISDHTHVRLVNLGDFELSSPGPLIELLRVLQVDRIQVHGTIDFDAEAPARIARLAEESGIALEVVVHDYQLVCPRINLADARGRYCGEPEEKDCDRCLEQNGSVHGVLSIRDWREDQRKLVDAATRLTVPDADVSRRLARYFPDSRFDVVPHDSAHCGPVAPRCRPCGTDAPLEILVVGAIGLVKGFEVLLACAREAAARSMPLRFSVLGYSMDDRRLAEAGVAITGRYLETDGPQRLLDMDPHLVWLPSLWPETYSYTLSLALDSGYRVCAFDIGAIAERLRACGREEDLLPLSLQDDLSALLAHFMAIREALLPPDAPGFTA